MNFVGDKFLSLGSERFNRTAICAHLRNDLKTLFPKPWKFSVSKDGYSRIQIKVLNVPKEAVLYPENGIDDRSFEPNIWKKLNDVVNAYNYDNSDAMTDYFDCNYYVYWNFEKCSM